MRTPTIITICVAIYVFLVTNVFLKRSSKGFFQHEDLSICDFGVWMGIIVTLLLALQAYLIEADFDNSSLHTMILAGVIGLMSFWLLLLASIMNAGVFLLMIPAGIAQVVTLTQLNWK